MTKHKSSKADAAKLPRSLQELILDYADYQPPEVRMRQGDILENHALHNAVFTTIGPAALIATLISEKKNVPAPIKGTVIAAGALTVLPLLPIGIVVGVYTGLKDLSMFAKETVKKNRAFSTAAEVFDTDLLHHDYLNYPLKPRQKSPEPANEEEALNDAFSNPKI